MKILITGSNGFIGRHLVSLCLSKGFYVTGFDIHSKQISPAHSYYDYISLDILSDDFRPALLECSPDVIFNLAANVDISSGSPSSFAVNYLPLVTLLDFSRSRNATLIHASSMLVCHYGKVHNSRDFIDSPSTVYGYSKIISEQLVFNYLDQYPRTDIRIARLTTVWGYGMYGPISKLFNHPRFLFTCSSFKGYKTFSYVENCCIDLLSLAFAKHLPTVSLIGDSEYLTTHQFIKKVRNGYQLAGFNKPFLINIPYFLLFFVAIISDLFPPAYRRFKFNSFHLRNYVLSNKVNPLLHASSPDPLSRDERVSFESAVVTTINSYQHPL
tara:strand:+ start:1664 stop:2644 length:981 start_codon:yes stop_codon:yes gene_type:complete